VGRTSMSARILPHAAWESSCGERGGVEQARVVVARGRVHELGGRWASVGKPHASSDAPAEVSGCNP
jgi:hypothetical protein